MVARRFRRVAPAHRFARVMLLRLALLAARRGAGIAALADAAAVRAVIVVVGSPRASRLVAW
jgi:hypothetical protein